MIAGKAAHTTGFTLIELLITLAVAIIIATIAVPGFQRLVSSNREASDYNEILTGLNYARSEAVKRRERVQAELAPTEGGAWQLTVTEADGTELLVRQARDGRISTGSLNVTFNALGRRESCSSSDCEVAVDGKAIQVNAMGRVGKPTDSQVDEEDGAS